jgi:hypothetical protein
MTPPADGHRGVRLPFVLSACLLSFVGGVALSIAATALWQPAGVAIVASRPDARPGVAVAIVLAFEPERRAPLRAAAATAIRGPLLVVAVRDGADLQRALWPSPRYRPPSPNGAAPLAGPWPRSRPTRRNGSAPTCSTNA